MKRKQSYLMVALLILVFSLVAIFSLVACNSNEKTAGVQITTDIPVTSKSDKAKAAFQQALALADEGSAIKAKEMFTKTIELDPDLGIAYLYRSNYAQSSKEYMDDLAKAKAHLNGASEWEKMYYDFQTTFATNDWNKRLDIAQKIVVAYPSAARAQIDLGSTYQAANQTDKERAAYQKAIELDPKWIVGYSSLGASYLFSEPKDFKKAEENALKAAELSPKNPTAQIAVGDCYRAQNDLDKARAAYAKAIELNPNDPAGYYKRGHINSFLGKYDEARSDYMEGIKHDNSNLGGMMDIGNTYLYAGDHNAAMQSFMDASAKADASGASKSQIANDKLNYLYSCAITCFHYGDVAHLKETIAMMQGPADQDAADVGTEEEKSIQKANLLYWWVMADAAEGKLDDAKAKAEEMKNTLEPLKTPTKLQDYEMALGYISMKEKKYTDAISHFEKTNPINIYNKYWLAMANEAAGNKDKAMELFKQVSIYNFNDIGYAVVRNEVKKKLTMQ